MAVEMSTRQQKVWAKTNGHCAYCGVPLNPPSLEGGDPNRFCVDHINARFNGGKDGLENLAPSCSRCNCTKRARSLEEFREIMLYKTHPRFTLEHIARLEALGVTLPTGFPCYSPYAFWFETQGIQL
jgi:5-methylcytosine-specific restriction endonuclease McrA